MKPPLEAQRPAPRANAEDRANLSQSEAARLLARMLGLEGRRASR